MRIAIDYTSAITERAGIGRYTRGLVAALAQREPPDTTDSLTLFTSEAPPLDRPFPQAPHIHPLVRSIGHRNLTRLWYTLRFPLPAEFLMGTVDLIHGPDFIIPPVLRAKRLVTIHDLAYLKCPACAQPGIVDYLTAVVPRALRAADHVIAISEGTANDLMEQFAVPRNHISVIYPGVDAIFTSVRDAGAIQAVCQRYGLEQPFVLAVSTIEPRKNYQRLIEAFALARQHPGGPTLLVIVGRKGWLYDEVFAAVEKHQLTQQVRFLEYIPDNDLAQLYQAAQIMAMPSLYEGFGLPVIEAMASGTPVICSTGGALPEIAGDAALLVAPEDVAGWSAALHHLTADADLRQQLVTRGLVRAQKFTWDAAATAHMRMYHQVGGK